MTSKIFLAGFLVSKPHEFRPKFMEKIVFEMCEDIEREQSLRDACIDGEFALIRNLVSERVDVNCINEVCCVEVFFCDEKTNRKSFLRCTTSAGQMERMISLNFYSPQRRT